LGDLEYLLLLLLGAAALVRAADLLRLPYPIVLVLGGLAAGLVPGLPEVVLDPEVVFLIFLPPLLLSAGFYASPEGLKAELRALAFLSIVLVLATMAAVAVVAHEVIDGLSWPAAFVLGAVVAPTDPIAAIATFSRLGVPQRVGLIVEGEALINDATALVAFRIAVAAAVTGTFEAPQAAADFVVSAVGGVAIGIGIAWLTLLVLRRQEERALAIFFTLTIPYAIYIAAEKAGVSGILAVVAAGIYMGWHQHAAFSADTRLSAIAFWEVLVFGLNATLFLLLGLQFPALVDEVPASLPGAALLVAATVIAVRLAAQFLPMAGIGDDWRERLVIGWSGMRGAISLAAALSIPLAVDGRSQIVYITTVVILVTLVGQGVTLPVLLRALKLEGGRPWSPDEAIARLEAAQAALDRLDELEEEGADEERLRRMRELYRARFRACQAVLGGESDGRPPPDPRLEYGKLRRELIGVERDTLLSLREQGRLAPDVMRDIQRDLDLEEARLR
jgi:CPA1 family monovalent cation:H+ antiporter